MTLDTANALARFFNTNSKRICARVLDFGDNGWVILSEKLEDGSYHINTEPIADPHDLLRRVQQGLVRMAPECHELLLAWQRSDNTTSGTEVTTGSLPSCGALPR